MKVQARKISICSKDSTIWDLPITGYELPNGLILVETLSMFDYYYYMLDRESVILDTKEDDLDLLEGDICEFSRFELTKYLVRSYVEFYDFEPEIYQKLDSLVKFSPLVKLICILLDITIDPLSDYHVIDALIVITDERFEEFGKMIFELDDISEFNKVLGKFYETVDENLELVSDLKSELLEALT